jgi:ribonuclease HI
MEVWTDGSCGHDRAGGWAWVRPEGEYRAAYRCGFESDTTNQRMELTAAYLAVLDHADVPGLMIVSDSAYVVNCFLQQWYLNWENRGWTNAMRKPVANRDLWEPFIEAVRRHPGVDFRHVRGHQGHIWNERADQLAVMARTTSTARAEGLTAPG